MTVASSVEETFLVDAVERCVAVIDEQLVELRERLHENVKKGLVGEAEWTRVLIDRALDRRSAATRDG